MVVLRRVAMLGFVILPMSLSFALMVLGAIVNPDFAFGGGSLIRLGCFLILPAVSAILYGMGSHDRARGRSWPGWVDGVAFALLIPGLLLWWLFFWVLLIIAARGGGSIAVWQ